MAARRARYIANAQLGVSLILLWLALTAGSGLAFGALAVLIATLASAALAPLDPLRVSITGLAGFAGFFLARSVVGGIDVARRAFHPGRPLAVTDSGYATTLPPGRARTLFVATISLLPGTLARDLDGDVVRVHSIAGDPRDDLRRLERRIAHLFRPGAGIG